MQLTPTAPVTSPTQTDIAFAGSTPAKPEQPVKLANSFPLLLLFAVPHEAEALRAQLTQRERFYLREMEVVSGKIGARRIVTACVGMGKLAVERNLPDILAHLDPCPVLMCGYAGALDPALNHAEVVRSATATSLFHAEGTVIHASRVAQCATIERVAATVEEKEKVRQKTGAEICDMEYATVERLAAARGFQCGYVRSISDVATINLPSEALSAAFDIRTQSATPFTMMLHFLKRPGDIGPFFRFVGGLKQTRERLTEALIEMITAEPVV